MKNKMIKLILLLAWATPLLAEPPRVMDILQKIDSMMAQVSDISAKVSLTQHKLNQGIKVYESLFFRRDSEDQFLILTLSPEAEKGNGYLRFGDNFWMYRRNTRTFQHISRDESIMGTDAKGGDFEKKKLAELYRPETDASGKEIITEEKLGKKDTYRFSIVAKGSDVTYPKMVIWVQKDNFLQLKVQSYSLSGTLMQTSYYPRYTVIDGKYILTQGIFVDEFEKGNKTLLDISGISLKKLDPSIFTKGYLENVSK